ncbi:hypothetical protein MLD38_036935 [Melastoma candidum]|uniref:Uncharacterized protein n=1 Tax=Melastoma candidum TaxID=119954 RepID=A0ACB9LM80_9MYRT|nr:hypothetical protein MLD38_040768 [Melastoma candidum]KAI4312083.1 hypothetical protein MLD38_036935 [Melastoma candidum]
MNASGLLQRLLRKKGSTSWDVMHSIPSDFCDFYEQCGVNGLCTSNKDSRCEILPSFLPKSAEDWLMLSYTGRCEREILLNCSNEGFQKVSSVKLTDMINFRLDKNMSLHECKAMCWNNCSCTAYANLDVRNGGSGCLI